jgi:raffinose/stachyose/melibiose transport system permease protein
MNITRRIKQAIIYIILTFFMVISVYPLIWMFFNSFKTNEEIFSTNPFGFPTEWQFFNYLKAFTNYRMDKFFLNSVIVAIGTVVLTCLLSLMFAYSVSRMRWKLSKVANIYLMTGLMIPIQVIMIPLVLIVRSLHLYNTYPGLILPYTAANLAFSATVFYGALRTIPGEMEEAACIDGANIYRTFFSIIMPIAKSSIATVIIFVFLNSWNEFQIAMVLTSKVSAQTLPLGLMTFMGEHTVDWGGMSAAMVVASFPAVLIYLLFSDRVENALTVGAAIK